MAGMLVFVGVYQSWSVSLSILGMCLISAVMALGVNIQWGYAGLFNAGVMGFTAIGGVAAVLVSYPPVKEAWSAGGGGIGISLLIMLVMSAIIYFSLKLLPKGKLRGLLIFIVLLLGLYVARQFFYPAVSSIESVDSAVSGFLGGMGLPILFSWIVGGVLAAAVAWAIGKVALGLRSDYLAIATLGISEIVIAVIKNEDWLTRGVKNVTGLKRPVPLEAELQQEEWFISLVSRFNESKLAAISDADAKAEMLRSLVIEGSGIFVKLCYAGLFAVVLLIVLALSIRALNSPWGRMMRAIRDNDEAASAMGKDIKKRHLQVFILGSAVIGIAGAMLTTLDGQLTPTSYQPLRFTFLVWVMVIVGGSGNNLGAVFGGFLIWFMWIEAEPIAIVLMSFVTSGMAETSALKSHLIESAPHLRLFLMGLLLLFVLRFSPKGILPEKVRHS
ncbi:branched-chain amino acid ABC transporter permease [Leucothrix pacifica]|uniref:Branched-chain amino acid ABC transporter permease n=2 Tax=Leucothrix pacifica TaxID=1247513 RepID=A0A317CQE7_9GAMM|nr:branched-chain amino acid ABC transporter permease [Leucothrix pacifica]